jgi:heptaprenylglyceryl phosphate synthase
MKVEKASFGHMIWLMPEEQKRTEAIETIRRLKEIGKVVVLISGSEDVPQVINKLINQRTKNL